MDFILSILLGTRLLAFLAGSGGTAAVFDQPQIIVTGSSLFMNCHLVKAFPPELLQLTRTATPVPLYLFVELHETGRKQSITSVTLENVLSYDLIGKTFTVRRNYRIDTSVTADIDSAVNAICTFNNFFIGSTKGLDINESYFITAYAVLGKSKVEALGGKPVDLMYYWNYKRPTIRTEPIEGDILVKK